MHEGHHGILEEPKKIKNNRQAPRVHGGGHDGVPPHAHDDPIKCETCDSPVKIRPSDLWMKIVAGGVVAVLVIVFLVWRFV